MVGVAVSAVIAVLTAPGSAASFFHTLWLGTFGSTYGRETLMTLATPLIFTGLACSIPYRIRLWNIGADGQMILGAWAATGIAFAFPHLAAFPLVPLMLVGSLAGGAVWMLLPAIARAYLGINEILSTLLLNFVAGFWLVYWAGQVWLAPQSAGGVIAKPIPRQSELSNISIASAPVPITFAMACVVAVALWSWFRYSKYGYETSILRSSEPTARYAGFSVEKRVVGLLLFGGALAGLGGASQLMGSIYQFGEGIAGSGATSTPGYTGIVIAILAAGSELGVLVMAIVFAVITAGSNILLVGGANSNLLPALLATTLVIAAIGQGLSHVRLIRTRVRQPQTTAPGNLPSSPKGVVAP
jgi:ABC-type uncharacterized transport system permease subunit